jgi:hypothetical protein
VRGYVGIGALNAVQGCLRIELASHRLLFGVHAD